MDVDADTDLFDVRARWAVAAWRMAASGGRGAWAVVRRGDWPRCQRTAEWFGNWQHQVVEGQMDAGWPAVELRGWVVVDGGSRNGRVW